MRTTTVIGFAVLVVAASIGCSRSRGGRPVRWEWLEGTPGEAIYEELLARTAGAGPDPGEAAP
ncbi:MAG: hypothetical protein QME96_15415 [Myxococcota bacterium]|nr:hypothetical protein [Myxococcota bacterium]